MKRLVLISIAGATLLGADPLERRDGRRSLIDSDPDVIYVADLVPKAQEVEVAVTEPGVVYATKNGGRKLGVLEGGKVRLIGFDDRACKVQGQGKIGWVKPSILKAPEGNLWEQLQTVYEREMTVKKLIEAGEIALGMTRDEVCQVMGEPTKKTTRRTAEGMSGTLEFIDFEEIKHYEPYRDPYTGAVYQRYSHTTQEEKSKVVVEFENDAVKAIEESESDEGGDVKIVVRPVVWWW
ncbi:MAG: hypothetical protein Q7Q71_05000 [Verrucomicrobiota bacterium JB023]|nr:hypothetical protein [Verrucomicrobiota bacterium JB023]